MERPKVHITRWGDSGPRVILVRGGAQGNERAGEANFAAQRPLAERGWRLLVPDRPGHGRSPDPGRPDDAEADGAWVADLLEDGAHLVGHSFGGAVVLAAAVRRPAAVRSLTFIEPAMHAVASSDPRVRRFLFRLVATRLFSFSALSRARRMMKLLGIPAEFAPSDPAIMKRVGRSLGRARIPDKRTLERELDEVRRAGIPLLVVSGGWSPAFEVSCDLVAKLANGRRAVIASPHHFPQLVSGEFTEVLAAFMKESDAARSTRQAQG